MDTSSERGFPQSSLDAASSSRTTTPESSGDTREFRPSDTELLGTIILPTYNEAPNIVSAIQSVKRILDSTPVEILVVDDGSPDGTAEIVRSEYSDDLHVRVIERTDKPSGLAESVVDGFAAAAGEVYVVMDADLQHPPERLPDLLMGCLDNAGSGDGADIVLGTRFHEHGEIEDWSLYRRLVSFGATTLAQLFVPEARTVSDPMTGFFAVRKSAIEDVDLNPTGYKIVLEILSKGDIDSIQEIPYAFTDREQGESNLSTREYVRFLQHLFRLRFS